MGGVEQHSVFDTSKMTDMDLSAIEVRFLAIPDQKIVEYWVVDDP